MSHFKSPTPPRYSAKWELTVTASVMLFYMAGAMPAGLHCVGPGLSFMGIRPTGLYCIGPGLKLLICLPQRQELVFARELQDVIWLFYALTPSAGEQRALRSRNVNAVVMTAVKISFE